MITALCSCGELEREGGELQNGQGVCYNGDVNVQTLYHFSILHCHDLNMLGQNKQAI